MAIAEGSTLPEDQPISEAEIAVVERLVVNASMVGSLAHLRDSVRNLRVVGHCGCGCASVDFGEGGRSDPTRPIADGVGYDSDGRECGVILWSLGGKISGLEVYEHEPNSSQEIPAVATLKPWGGTAEPLEGSA